MSFGEVMGLLVIVGGIVTVFGMLTEAYKARMRAREKQFEAMAAQGSLRAADSETSDRIEARLRVLERIATDKGQDLARQIEQLREPAN